MTLFTYTLPHAWAQDDDEIERENGRERERKREMRKYFELTKKVEINHLSNTMQPIITTSGMRFQFNTKNLGKRSEMKRKTLGVREKTVVIKARSSNCIMKKMRNCETNTFLKLVCQKRMKKWSCVCVCEHAKMSICM